MNLIEQLGGLIYGVGINDRSRPAYINNKATKEYDHWIGMLERCYSNNKHIKSRPTYIGCTVSENFRSYSYFYDWCQKQVGFNRGGWQLDKDLLIKGNKFYSEDTCVFIPSEINNFLLIKTSRNSSGYTGVSYHKASSKYAVQMNFNGKRKHLGLFDDPKEGEKYYFVVKYKMAIELVKKYNDEVDKRVINSLQIRFDQTEEIKAWRRL